MIVLAADQKLSAGPIGLVVIVLLLLATVLLIRSMNGRLRRLPGTFTPPAAPPPVEPAATDRPTSP